MMAHCKGTILITGANGGLGHELVSKIVSTPEFVGFHGIYAVRNPEAAPALRSALSRSIAAHHHTVESLDLSRLSSVRAFAEAVNGRVLTGELPPIRALILSAGYHDMGEESYTEDGFDMSFASNYLGHWLLTLMLLKSMNQECGRIVVVGSSSHDVKHPMHKFTGYYEEEEWKTFFRDDKSVDAIARGTWATKGSANPAIIGGRRYGAAKICLVMMIGELQRRLDTDPILSGISIVGVDPGTMYTSLTRRSDYFTRFLLLPTIMLPLSYILALFQRNPAVRTPSRSARDVLRAAVELDSKYRGVYFDGTELGSVSSEAADIGKRRIVWQHSVKYTNLTERDTSLISWA